METRIQTDSDETFDFITFRKNREYFCFHYEMRISHIIVNICEHKLKIAHFLSDNVHPVTCFYFFFSCSLRLLGWIFSVPVVNGRYKKIR